MGGAVGRAGVAVGGMILTDRGTRPASEYLQDPLFAIPAACTIVAVGAGVSVGDGGEAVAVKVGTSAAWVATREAVATRGVAVLARLPVTTLWSGL